VITLKVGSGSKGFGFWADLSAEAPAEEGSLTAGSSGDVPLYQPLTPDFDPYEFHYW
jgi:hypothetical protein